MKKFIAGAAIYAVGLFGIGALLLPATADAAVYRYWAKCQGPTYAHPQRHTIYQTYNNVWKFLVPWCPAGYNYAGAIYTVAYYPSNGYWQIPG